MGCLFSGSVAQALNGVAASNRPHRPECHALWPVHGDAAHEVDGPVGEQQVDAANMVTGKVVQPAVRVGLDVDPVVVRQHQRRGRGRDRRPRVARAGPQNPWQNATAASPCFVLAHNNWINIKTDADGGLDDFSSYHPGGVNLLFADGSVHFVRSILGDGQDRRDFWALGTRAGEDVVQSLDY